MSNSDDRVDNGSSGNEVIRSAWQRGLNVLKPTKAQIEHGLELHARSLTCDNFGFLPSVWTQETKDLWNELKQGSVGARELAWRTQLARCTCATRDPRAADEFTTALKAARLDCMVLTVAEGKCREEDIKRMSASAHLCRAFRHSIVQAGSCAEVEEARRSGRTAIVWSVNGPPLAGKLVDLDEELSWLDAWHNLGVRLMHLTYNRRNFVGDGCAERTDAGLSDLGVELVRRLNQVGIIVDAPHSGKQTTLDAARISSKPIMASHTAAQGIFRNIRCKSDEEIKAIAGTGGLVGVYTLPRMLGPNADLNTLLDHVQYIARIVGADHVAIGTDMRYLSPWPADIAGYPKARYSADWWGNWRPDNQGLPPSDEAASGSLAWTNWPLYTIGLVSRGFSDADIEKILGLNFMRVLDANRPTDEVRV